MALDLPPDLYEMYKSDPEETYGKRKSRVQWIQRYWAEEWFYYHFVTPEYSAKNVVRPPWADIVYRKLILKTKADALALSFYPCMVRGVMPQDPDPSSIRWCHEDELFEANYQFARSSAEQNKKEFGIDFNPAPAEPRTDGSHEADPNLTGPWDSLKAYIEHLDALRTAAAAAQGEAQAEDNAPASPKPQRKTKASKAKGA
jgi:hypothetical protein